MKKLINAAVCTKVTVDAVDGIEGRETYVMELHGDDADARRAVARRWLREHDSPAAKVM